MISYVEIKILEDREYPVVWINPDEKDTNIPEYSGKARYVSFFADRVTIELPTQQCSVKMSRVEFIE